MEQWNVLGFLVHFQMNTLLDHPVLDIGAYAVDLTFKKISFLGLWVWLLGVSNDPDHTNNMWKFPPPKVVVFTSLNALSRTRLKFN